MSNPARRTPESQLTSLENIFGFENEAFRRYMRLGSGGRSRAARLVRLGEEMSTDAHPIVAHAAGWAAAEAVIHRAKPGERGFSLERRRAALATAQERWSYASSAFGDPERMRAAPARQRPQLLGFQWRAQFALAHAPSMGLAAEMLDGGRLSTARVEAMLAQTKSSVVELGAAALGATLSNDEERNVRDGFCYEVLADLLLQDSRPVQSLIMPGSIRQDHHPNPDLRADLLAISTDAAAYHPRTLIQVSSENETPGASRFTIRSSELILHRPGETAITTLTTYIEREQGILDDPNASASLDALSHDLTERLANIGATR